MQQTMTEKILEKHFVEGEFEKGKEIGVKIDQTLTQDSTGTMAYLELERMGIDKVKTKRSLAYIDHNMLQTGYENADDHRYIASAAKKYGIYLSKPGNGICHQVNLERFSVPGDTLLGSDSHTPTAGAIGSLAIGAGGLDVAAAMAGYPYYMKYPEIVKVTLTGKLSPWVSAKDIILEILRRLGVKGGLGKIFEYTGEGVKTLSVPERATITNMGAELGATTSIFPSDEVTYEFLQSQSRQEAWKEFKPDEEAVYDSEVVINLDELVPLVAMPHSPDNVHRIDEVEDIKIDQVAIGSCTNSSYKDLMRAATILADRTVPDDVSLVISPGSKQVLTMLAENGKLADLISSGARILECACGPCIGMGQAPASGSISVRTFNRNFKGRCGTSSAEVILASPEVAAVSALEGRLTDPRKMGDFPQIEDPDYFKINDNSIIPPAEDSSEIEIQKGPNIKPVPIADEPGDRLQENILIKVGDNVTTDHIMPSSAKLLPLRSNIPALAEYCLTPLDNDFPQNCKDFGGGIIVGGENYGQGSSREHAALAPLYLGVKAVVAKSFARIHKANLINFGIIPFVFKNKDDYNKIAQKDKVVISELRDGLESGEITVYNETQDLKIPVEINLSERQLEIIKNGGLLNLIKNTRGENNV